MRKSVSHQRILAFCLAMLLLLVTYVAPVHAFVNGQSAVLVIGQKDFTSYGAALSRSGLHNPQQVTFDPSGNMWVTDLYNHRVLEFRPPFSDGMNASIVIGQRSFIKSISPVSQSGFGPAEWHGTVAAIFDSSGDLWVVLAGADLVAEFKPPFSTGMNATLEIGWKDFNTPYFGNPRGEFNLPHSAAFDPSGNLWVLDSGDNRVLEFQPPFTMGMNASLVLGQKNFQDSASSLSRSGLDAAYGALAVDSAGNVWVGDSYNDRIMEFRPPFSNGMNASVVIGQQDFVTRSSEDFGCCGSPLFGLAYGQSGMIFDQAGDLWATYYNKVLEFKPPFVSGMTEAQASLEIGQPNLTSNYLDDQGRGTWTGGTNGLFQPNTPGFDSSGNLWVPDGNNNRVLEFVAGAVPSAQTTSQAPALGFLPLVAVGVVAVMVIAGVATVLVRRRGFKAIKGP